MHKVINLRTAICALSLAIAGASGAHAQTDTALLGTWKATGISPGALVKLVLTNTSTSGGLQVQAFTLCAPALCDLGTVPGTVYSTGPANPNGTTFLATFTTPVRTVIVTGTVNNTSSIMKETDFNQASDIVPPPDNYVESNTFRK